MSRALPIPVALGLALVVFACAPSPEPEPDATRGPSTVSRSHSLPDGVEARADAAVASSESLRFTVTFRNAGASPKTLEYGACPLNPVLRRDGREVWNYSKVERACLMYLAVVTVEPGDTLAAKEFVLTLPIAAVRGDSIKAGRYDVLLLANWNNEIHQLEVGSLEVP